MTHKAARMRDAIEAAAGESTITGLRSRNAEMFRTEDGYVRLRWQGEGLGPAPAVLHMGKGDNALAFGLSREHVQTLAVAFTEMARGLA